MTFHPVRRSYKRDTSPLRTFLLMLLDCALLVYEILKALGVGL